MSTDATLHLPDSLPPDHEVIDPSEVAQNEAPADQFEGHDPELWLYRDRTIAMLRQYLRFAIEVGRLPSILGREFFRSRVTSYTMSSFEDAVIFVHDVDRVLERLAFFHQELISTVIFQEYTKEQAAEVLHCARKTVTREFPSAIDCVTEMFLEGELLNRLPLPVEKTCQEGESTDFSLSDCK